MKAKELRIGNHFKNNGVIVTIDARSIFDIWDDKGLKDYQPILLTEEWLVKFGFDMDDSGGLYKDIMSIDTNNRVLFLYWDEPHDEVWLLDEDHHYEICSVQKVHQLQNLYFALTGEELEMKQ
jgi:hypothetical protein